MKFIFPVKTGKSDMIKLILEITQDNWFKSKKSEKSHKSHWEFPDKASLISCKISGTFYAKSREKNMEFEENKEKFEEK